MEEERIIIITGPTASGKSDVAIDVAKSIRGEIVCADSMQIYIGMDIGTAKTTLKDQENILHHMQDIIYPNENYSVALYKENAIKCIKDILAKGKTPIVCGGTGQYISALVEGTNFIDIKTDIDLRKNLELEYEINGKDYFYDYLKKIDPVTAEKLHVNDKKRILRAVEIFRTTGFTKSQIDAKSKEEGPEFNFATYCIYHDREILYKKIDMRVDDMIANGLIEEAGNILNKYPDISKTAIQAIGYKELKDYFEGFETLDTAIEKIKQASRNYAKRQLTWFRKMEGITWIKNESTKATVEIILAENK